MLACRLPIELPHVSALIGILWASIACHSDRRREHQKFNAHGDKTFLFIYEHLLQRYGFSLVPVLLLPLEA
jgi:hypothetical protein